MKNCIPTAYFNLTTEKLKIGNISIPAKFEKKSTHVTLKTRETQKLENIR